MQILLYIASRNGNSNKCDQNTAWFLKDDVLHSARTQRAAYVVGYGEQLSNAGRNICLVRALLQLREAGVVSEHSIRNVDAFVWWSCLECVI